LLATVEDQEAGRHGNDDKGGGIVGDDPGAPGGTCLFALGGREVLGIEGIGPKAQGIGAVFRTIRCPVM
jgi:hypothetical protein